MALAPIPTSVWNDFRLALTIIGESATVKPRGAPAKQVLLAIGERRSDELTDGISMSKKVVRVMAPDWDTAIGRAPERGDVITASGLRFAVTDSTPMMVGGAVRMYVIGVDGG